MKLSSACRQVKITVIVYKGFLKATPCDTPVISVRIAVSLSTHSKAAFLWLDLDSEILFAKTCEGELKGCAAIFIRKDVGNRIALC